MPALDPFKDSGDTLSVTVLDVLTDSAGNRWAVVQETRHALIHLSADVAERALPGDAYSLRPDLVEAS